MPDAPATVKQFTALVVRSRLLTAAELRDALKHVKSTGSEKDDLEIVRRTLVGNKLLTEHQAALLMRGHADGFFLGPYKILELIAKGRMSGVYKAAHSSGQLVAIKVLPASKARDPEVLARFQREARLLTKLNHPNVVRAFQVGQDGGKNYLVLEYLDGDTLEELLEKWKRLPPIEAIRIVHQAMLGLQHLHEKGMIHRDMKPANIVLVDPPGQSGDGATDRAVKVLDIGLGKEVFEEGTKSPVDDPAQLTTDGMLIGTPDYISPEQARSARSVDIRADIYSLGCVLYHALTGQPPFPDKSVLNTVMRHATEPPKPLSEFLPEVPDGLQTVLNWMLAKDPGQRYPTPERAAQALQVLLRNAPPPRPAAAPDPRYLQWLEQQERAEPARPVPQAAPAAPAQGIPVGKLAPTPARKPEPAPAPESRKPAGSAPLPVPAAPAAPAPAAPAVTPAAFDVELVLVPDPQPPKRKGAADEEPRGLLELDRRDAIMLSAGGVLGGLAFLAGWGLNRLLSRTPPPPEPPDPNAPKEG